LLLLTFSPRYQRWFGQRQVETAIDRWYAADRLSDSERDNLYESLSGDEVRAYTRGFGMHLALKALAPLIAPAKVGGIAGFIASGQIWFLLPLLLTPLLRTSVTLISAWNTRHRQIAHGEALLMGLLPTVGSLAFPLQMFSSRGDLSIFLIRDAASRLGQKIPVYGGADSRTEIALIQWADCIVELLDVLSGATKRLSRPRMDAAGVRIAFASRADQSNHPQGRTRLGHWIDRQAILAIESQSHSRRPAFTMDVPISEAVDDRRAA